MVNRKEKKKEAKIAVRPPQGQGEMTAMRPVDLWSEIDKMFDNFRSGFDGLFWPWRQESTQSFPIFQRRTPPMDLADKGDYYEMRVEMPGIPKDKINIEVTPSTIEISAQHDETREDTDETWLRKECSTMSYYRSLELPEELKTDDIDAEFNDGVLNVKLPKVEPTPEQKPRKIKIK